MSSRDGGFELYLVPSTGGTKVQLTRNRVRPRARLVAGRARIAFSSRRNGSWDIYLKDLDRINSCPRPVAGWGKKSTPSTSTGPGRREARPLRTTTRLPSRPGARLGQLPAMELELPHATGGNLLTRDRARPLPRLGPPARPPEEEPLTLEGTDASELFCSLSQGDTVNAGGETTPPSDAKATTS